MTRAKLKHEVILWRLQGKTYSEIQRLAGNISKSTISLWCRDLRLTAAQEGHIKVVKQANLARARQKSLQTRQARRDLYLQSVLRKNEYLKPLLKNKHTAKIALAMLFLGEGTKNPKRSGLVFGNSDYLVIKLFLQLLRYCYKIDERRLHCTVQCRADQNVSQLQKFWSSQTKIPLTQFYKAQIDPRTIGRASKRLDYKGVCRIDYLSSEVFIDILKSIEVITGR